MTTVRLAFSPDADDAFMFHALLTGAVTEPGLDFVAECADTETLNARAEQGDVDVLAVSIARYAAIADRWLLLPHGMSVGRGYGPVVVRRAGEAIASLADLANKRVAVPGARTTANLVLKLLAPPFEGVVVPIQPFDRVFRALRTGEVDAAVLIHEGRLTFAREGFELIADLGAEWARATGLPLPLGGNVIRRALGADVIARVSRACRASIGWALEHKDAVLDALVKRDERDLGRALLDRYLDLYANADTASLQPDVARAVEVLFARAREKALIHDAVRPEYAP